MDESKLQMLLDKAEISDVQLRYATGLDTRNWALFQTCFTDEFDADFTSVFGGTAQRVSAAKWAESARRTLSGLAATQHIITNHVITVGGDKALCVAYVQAQHYLPNDQGDSTQTMGGYYTNHFVRTKDGWRISSCKLTLTWNKGNWGIFALARDRMKKLEAEQ